MIDPPCVSSTHIFLNGRCTRCKAPLLAGATVHGVPASPRSARLWAYMRERGIGLTSFSTDECVAREQSRLRAALDEAERRAKAKPDDWQAKQIARDVAAILRRVPEARTDTDAAVKRKAATEPAKGTDLADPLGMVVDFDE